jgi:hypothetical protein
MLCCALIYNWPLKSACNAIQGERRIFYSRPPVVEAARHRVGGGHAGFQELVAATDRNCYRLPRENKQNDLEPNAA